MSPYWIAAVVAYLLGSIPFGFLLVRVVRGQDIRTQGSGNIGATNVLRSGARGLGALTFLLDGAKGYVAVVVAEWLARNYAPALALQLTVLATLAVVLGHVYPVWLRFKGGKGVATAFGAFIALCPWAAGIAFAVFLVLVALSRYVSLGSIVAALLLPFLTLWMCPGRYTSVWRVTIFVTCWLVVAKHWQNMARLARGTEHRLGRSKPTA